MKMIEGRRESLDRGLAAFLPGALEVEECPPNPIARWLAVSIVLLVAIAVAWAVAGEVNVVASAEGKIIPSARVKEVQPLEKGVISAVLVAEGERVDEGQPLVEMERTRTAAEERRVTEELHAARLQLAMDRGLLNLLQDSAVVEGVSGPADLYIGMPKGTLDIERGMYQELLWQRWSEYRAGLAGLARSLEQNRAQQAASGAVISKLEQTAPIAAKRAQRLARLHAKDFVSEAEYLDAEQQRIQQEQDLAAERHRLRELQAGERGLHEQISAREAKMRADTLQRSVDLQQRVQVLEAELTKARDASDKRLLRSPVTGVVQGITANTVGGVVTDAEVLMEVVPEDSRLEVEAFLENKDVGFVEAGMPAEVKVHTFPFTKYGVVNAEVRVVSANAVIDEQRGLIYRVALSLERETIRVGLRDVALIPGMSVTAEIKTGHRRIAEFFVRPVKRRLQESLGER